MEKKKLSDHFIGFNHGTEQIKIKGIPKEELRPIEVHMRENGTLDNKPSFAIIMVDKSGNRYLGQLSLKMMNTGFNDIGYEIKKISNG